MSRLGLPELPFHASPPEPTPHLALASLPRRIARRPRRRAPSQPSEFREFRDGQLVAGTRYRVVRLLGTGGMGRVYEVEHVELGKRFVLKALQSGLARRVDLVARLRNEWRALARLEHPSIVSVTDAGTSGDGVTFYVMERLEGETLAVRLFRHQRLLPQAALAIAAGILEGLSAAHQIGVVHRDVKPGNVFLTGPTSVKVFDFGIAKIDDASNVITARGTAVGTPRYMSPEQAHGIEVDARSDIYAAGLILYEMVSGRGPFDDARDPEELLLAQLERSVPLLSTVSVVAPELDALVAGMLAKDPRERPHDAHALAQQLRLLLRRYDRFVSTDEPTLALPSVRASGCLSSLASPLALELDTTTLRPPPPRPATLYGSNTLVDGATSAPTVVPGPRSEPTEPLSDPGSTRTALPVAEAPPSAPPGSAPPPRSPRPLATPGLHVAAFLAAAVGVLLLAVSAIKML